MPGPSTPILALTKPSVGGDSGIWGGELNGDLDIIDNLGAVAEFSVSSNYVAVLSSAVETYIGVTTGSSTITVTLLAPSAANAGKVFTVAKEDSGSGHVNIVPASGLINGLANYQRAAQWGYARILSTGSKYVIIGNN